MSKPKRMARRVPALLAVVGLCFACSGNDSFKLGSSSMCPTLGPGDHVKTKQTKDLHRGDVVIVRDPTRLTSKNNPISVPTVVTRIVAGPGDVVATQNGHLVLNDQTADEPWL